MRKSHFLKIAGVAEREEREGQWRCTVSPGAPLQLRTSDLEMNEPRGHTGSTGPGGAGKPESRGELGRISLPPRSIHPAREGPRPPGGMLRRRCKTARRPTLTAARSAALPTRLRASAAQAGPRFPSASGSRGAGTGRVGVGMPARSRGGKAAVAVSASRPGAAMGAAEGRKT